MLEIIAAIERLKKHNEEIYRNQISNNFKVEPLTIENYIEWLSEQERS